MHKALNLHSNSEWSNTIPVFQMRTLRLNEGKSLAQMWRIAKMTTTLHRPLCLSRCYQLGEGTLQLFPPRVEFVLPPTGLVVNLNQKRVGEGWWASSKHRPQDASHVSARSSGTLTWLPVPGLAGHCRMRGWVDQSPAAPAVAQPCGRAQPRSAKPLLQPAAEPRRRSEIGRGQNNQPLTTDSWAIKNGVHWF